MAPRAPAAAAPHRRARRAMRDDDGDDARDDAREDALAPWRALGVRDAVARAMVARKLARPTATQRAVVPRALGGRDVCARAPTGSGKTMAYLVPMLDKICARGGATVVGPRGIVLTPTRELAHQTRRACAAVLRTCAPDMRAGELPVASAGTNVLRETAGSPPDVLVATPARVAECARGGYFPPGALGDGLEMVVLDEADLLLSFGYVDDIKCVMKAVKRGTQVMMLSATMSKEIEELRDVVAHKPTTIDVDDEEDEDAWKGEAKRGRGRETDGTGYQALLPAHSQGARSSAVRHGVASIGFVQEEGARLRVERRRRRSIATLLAQIRCSHVRTSR